MAATKTATPVPDVILGVTVTLSKEEAAALVARESSKGGNPDMLAAIAQCANDTLRSLATGGRLLPPEIVNRLAADGVNDSRDLVRLVEKALSVENGRLVLRWIPDPSWVSSIEEIGRSQGRSAQEVFQGLLTHVITKGWLYSVPTDRLMTLTKAEAEALALICGVDIGEPFFASDIIAAFDRQRADLDPLLSSVKD